MFYTNMFLLQFAQSSARNGHFGFVYNFYQSQKTATVLNLLREIIIKPFLVNGEYIESQSKKIKMRIYRNSTPKIGRAHV